jgi:hypothetical protein
LFFVLALFLIAVLNFAASLISLALLRSGLKGRPIPGCGTESGCDAVQKSRWAHMGPVPVAAGASAAGLRGYCESRSNLPRPMSGA